MAEILMQKFKNRSFEEFVRGNSAFMFAGKTCHITHQHDGEYSVSIDGCEICRIFDSMREIRVEAV